MPCYFLRYFFLLMIDNANNVMQMINVICTPGCMCCPPFLFSLLQDPSIDPRKHPAIFLFLFFVQLPIIPDDELLSQCQGMKNCFRLNSNSKNDRPFHAFSFLKSCLCCRYLNENFNLYVSNYA